MRYKDKSMQACYLATLELAADPDSELYIEGRQRRGAGHRCAFWDGYNLMPRSAHIIPGTLSAVFGAAGKEFRRRQDKAGAPLVPRGAMPAAWMDRAMQRDNAKG